MADGDARAVVVATGGDTEIGRIGEVVASTPEERTPLSYEDLDDGIRVRETSSDQEVTRLIRAHAAKGDDFVARGRVGMHEETLLPND
ncbi:MAG TPA: hypothetical protein VMT85_24950 [Thermoanaerobaculia bacterium]|nr:hypothetical protein [Thermoanaerobaculia bacterium]